MALTSTTITGDITATALKCVVTSATGFAAGQVAKIDGEYMLITKVTGTTISLGMRGYNGTAAVAHDLLSTITTTADNSDWTVVPTGASTDRPPYALDVVSVGENGTIACPTRDTVIMLTKATALASTTLGNPPLDRDGLRVMVTSATDAAHVITGVFADGTTGTHTTATYAAFNGASMDLVAQQGTWNTTSTAINVTIS
jgi:hypothetical protein